MKRYTDIKEANRELRKLDKALRDLTLATGYFLRSLDTLMANPRQPTPEEWGKRMALLSNALEYSRDVVRYFTLDIDFLHDPEIKDGKRLPARR